MAANSLLGRSISKEGRFNMRSLVYLIVGLVVGFYLAKLYVYFTTPGTAELVPFEGHRHGEVNDTQHEHVEKLYSEVSEGPQEPRTAQAKQESLNIEIHTQESNSPTKLNKTAN
ncbi:hypothetical protein ACLKA6_010388 [Drosophila palustris]